MNTLEENVAILKNRMAANVAKLKADLEPWIDHHSVGGSGDPNDNFCAYYTEISAALLETAIDRYIRLHDAPDALGEKAFRRASAADGSAMASGNWLAMRSALLSSKSL